MKNATRTQEEIKAATAKVIKMRSDGAKWPEILQATGFSHSRAELIWMDHVLPSAERDRCRKLVKDQGLGPASVALRAEGHSWGEIAVRVGHGEGKVRTAFRDASGNKSQGQRIGKGGRYYLAEGVLYQDTLRPTGTVIPKDAVGREGARFCAATQRLMNLEFSELKNLAKDHGINKVTTKAQAVTAIVKAMGLKDTTKKEAKAS